MKEPRFRVKLSAVTVALIAVATFCAVFVCIYLFTTVYSRAVFRDLQINSDQSVRQTTLSVENYLSSMEEKLEKVCARADSAESVDDFLSYADVAAAFEKDIYALMVYDSDGNLIAAASDGLTLKENRKNDLSYNSGIYSDSDGFSLSSPHVQNLYEGSYPWVVTLSARRDSALFGENVSIAIDFRFSEIAKYIDKVGVGRHGYCYVMDEAGNIVYHPQQQLIFSGLKNENAADLKSFPDGIHTEKNIMYTIQTTADKRWRVVGVSSTDELYVERRTQIVSGIVVSALCCLFIALLTLILYSHIVTRPVKRLVRSMREFEKNADTMLGALPGNYVSELRELNDSFTQMAYRIHALMERVRREETELRKTELRALQAQINPHFLYNTLDSILWMCEQGNNEDAVKMVSALAKLFRISISKGRELITVREELQHAQSYLVIQSFRYKNQFSYTFDVDENLNEYLCNKITIQPLIENAIYHGIDRMVDEGCITVTVKQWEDDPEDICITVRDNGVGMTGEQCRKILQKDRSDSGGIGVKNVNDRLKITFGEKYGLSIESELDVGTCVTVRIPKIKEEPKHGM